MELTSEIVATAPATNATRSRTIFHLHRKSLGAVSALSVGLENSRLSDAFPIALVTIDDRAGRPGRGRGVDNVSDRVCDGVSRLVDNKNSMTLSQFSEGYKNDKKTNRFETSKASHRT